MKTTASALALSFGLLALGVLPAAAAQTETTEVVVVTGSRIPVDPLTLSQQVVNIDQTAIENTGLTSTADILQRLPLAGGGLNAKFNNSGNFGNPPDGGGVGAGAAEVDLRYLSSKRVLVLVDGLRWIPGSSASGVPGAVDLNTIPYPMIERIEVLQEGASPIYGTDAIAGVVNIITKSHQEGLQASAQWGQYGQGDGDLTDINASWGANMGRTSIVAGVGYFNQEGVFAADRDISRFPNPFATSCTQGGCSSGTPLGRMIFTDPNTHNDLDITLNHAFGPTQGGGSCPAGQGCPFYNPADPTGAGEDFHNFDGAGAGTDRFNFQPYNFVVTPSERESIFAHVRHEFTDHIYMKVLATYTDRRSVNQAAPLPLFVGPGAGNGNLLDTVTIDSTNPYNPFGFDLDNSNLVFIGRRLIENGPRHYVQDVNTWNITVTFGGDLKVGSHTWIWDINGVWARNHADQRFTGNVNAQNVVTALGPLANCTGACVPLNIFGGEGSITPEMLHYIAFTEHDTSEQQLRDYTANLAGDLFELPAGPVGFAVGYEHRENEGFFEPDPIVAAGLSSDIPALPTKGSIDVDEIDAEFRVPILADMNFFKSLDLTVAGRWFDYSTSGWDSTYKVGVLWRPFDDVALRGSWGESFRAPSIGELFGSASRFDQEIVDPCNHLTVASPLHHGCHDIQGVPDDGSYNQLNPQLPVFVGGNEDLQPETSDAWAFGAVWSPEAMKHSSWSSNFTTEIVYTDIKVEGAIQAQDAALLLQRCAETGDAVACGTITRIPSGQVSRIENQLQNIAGIRTKALDLNIVWTSPESSWGTFNARWFTTFLLNFDEFVPGENGDIKISREGTERGSPDQAYPRTKSSLMVDWDMDRWGATAGVRYISSVRETSAANKLDATWYVDGQLRYTLPVMDDRFRLAIGSTNLFDEDPPGCISCGLNNYDPNAYDPPGRWFYIRLDYKE